MKTTKPSILLRLEYEEAAGAYLRSLPPEHFMEAKPQAQQRKITLASLAIVEAGRPDFQVFNEMLVQYPFGKPPTIRQVVPDNMVVLHPEPIKVRGSFNLPLQPVGPHWALEYVSKDSKRKDYDENFLKYERELKVPYYLLFHPDEQELLLFRRGKARYASVKPNARGRYALSDEEIEVAILDEWVRFWWKGELLLLPGALQQELDKSRMETARALRQAEESDRRAKESDLRAEKEARRAEEADRRAADLAQRFAEMEREMARLRAERLGPGGR